MSQLGQASVAALMQYVRFAQHEGLDADGALRAAGLPPDPLEAGLRQIDGEQFQRFLIYLTEHSKDPLLGLKSGQFVQPGSYSTLGYLVMTCSTLGEAIDLIAPYERLVGDMGVTRVVHHAPWVDVRWHCNYSHPGVRPHMMANVLSSWTLYARWLAAEDAAPQSVWFPFPAPDGNAVKAHEQVFRCPVHFDADFCGLRIPETLLDAPLRQPDPELKALLAQTARQQIEALSAANSAFTVQVRAVIRQQLEQGVIRRDMVAEAFRMSPRTLVRRLQEEGLTYQQLVDDVREELARLYVTETDLSFAEISHRLGFAEPRSFFRSFRRWTGTTPSALRQG